MINICYYSFLNCTGYGQAARDLILAISRSGKYGIRLQPIGGGLPRTGISNKQFTELRPLIKRQKVDGEISILHCTPAISKRFQKDDRTIGFATYETFDPPENWIDILNRNEAIIVPSRFNEKIFLHSSLKKPVYYVPHGFDSNIFKKGKRQNRDRFTFLFFGSWKQRKGYEVLLETWIRQFSIKDDIQLIIKTDKGAVAEKYVERACRMFGKKRKEIAPILFENKVLDEFSLAEFLQSIDCFISPSLGEGYGLCGLQCMAVGTPIILTKFAGILDYATDENSYLIEPDGFVMKACLDNIPQFRNRKWAFVSTKKIENAIRFAISNYGEMRKRAETGYKNVHENFTYPAIMKYFSEAIEQIGN